MIRFRVNPGIPGQTAPFLAFGMATEGSTTDLVIYTSDITPDQLEAVAGSYRTALEVHRLAATQAALVELEKGA